MEFGSMIFTEATMPKDAQIDNYHTPSIIETALSESTSIVHDETQATRKERFGFDSNMRRRFMKRPPEAEDSLRTIKAYNYMNPATVVMHNIPSSFGVDTVVTEKTIKTLLQKGVHKSTIEQIKEAKQDIIDYYTAGFQYAVSQLSEEERAKPENTERLRKQYCEFPSFPYILMGKDAEHSPALRVTTDDGGRNTYYAMCTTIPQNVDDLMCKTYISQCIHYMLGQMGEQCGIKEIGLDKDIYYDYLITENATLYLFLHLAQF